MSRTLAEVAGENRAAAVAQFAAQLAAVQLLESRAVLSFPPLLCPRRARVLRRLVFKRASEWGVLHDLQISVDNPAPVPETLRI